MSAPDGDERPPVVIGQQMADARAADVRNELARDEPSPLAGVAYSREAGEHDLTFFAPSSTDEVVRSAIQQYAGLDQEGRRAFRAAMSMDDLYTVLYFVRRAGLQAVRSSDPALATDAVLAAAVVDIERVDPRDLLWGASIAAHLARLVGIDEVAALHSAADLASSEVANHLRREAGRDHSDLADAMLAVVITADGPGLVDRSFEPFDPLTDLVGCAVSFARVLNADRYQARVSIAESRPPVWFPGAEKEAVVDVLGRCRGVAIVSGDLRESDPDFEGPMGQHFMALLIEARDAEDAERLSRWSAAPTDDPASLAVQVGPPTGAGAESVSGPGRYAVGVLDDAETVRGAAASPAVDRVVWWARGSGLAAGRRPWVPRPSQRIAPRHLVREPHSRGSRAEPVGDVG